VIQLMIADLGNVLFEASRVSHGPFRAPCVYCTVLCNPLTLRPMEANRGPCLGLPIS
jgi:hypothetical protein